MSSTVLLDLPNLPLHLESLSDLLCPGQCPGYRRTQHFFSLVSEQVGSILEYGLSQSDLPDRHYDALMHLVKDTSNCMEAYIKRNEISTGDRWRIVGLIPYDPNSSVIVVVENFHATYRNQAW